MPINIIEYFEKGALELCPNKTAIEHGQRAYSFAEVQRYAKRCAASLIRRCDVTREPIAVFLGQSAYTIVADLGICYSGNIFSNLDVKAPPLRTKGIIEKIQPALIITSKVLGQQLIDAGIPENRLFHIEDIFDQAVEFDAVDFSARRDRLIDTDPLCIIHTSGSTGLPKGVVLNHRSVIDFMDWCFSHIALDGSERIGSLSPFHFDIYLLEIIFCLAKGATLVIVPSQFSVFPMQLVQFLADRKIGFIFWVPSIMVNISAQDLLKEADCSALKTILFAGEVFPTKHLNHWRRALPKAAFINLYGPIEISVDCTYFVVERDFSDEEALPIGFPCRNTDILILNENNRPCAVGELGELCVRGSSLAMGYWNDPDKTAAAFVQNPLNVRYPELIYRTGDLVLKNERGEIIFSGRKDFQIKHMGYRIELPEIEHQIVAIEGITNACVLYNAAEKQIVAFYEARPETGLTPARIRKELMAIFPKYMVPTAFHEMPELPRNPNGKIDRNGLKELLSDMAHV